VRVYGDANWHLARALDPEWNLWQKMIPSSVMALLAMGISGLIYLDAYARPARHRQLLTWGMATQGVITDRRDIKGKGSRTYLYYEFMMENGVHVQAKWSGSPLLRITPGIGDPVTVIHMPGQAKPNIVYEVCVYQISDDGQRI
jgi:hypothetical protein